MTGSKKIIFILILLILAGGVGYWLWNKPVYQNQPPPASPATPPPTAQAPADETTNWKTYRNEKYEFEFEYPQSGKIVTQKPLYGAEYTIFANTALSSGESSFHALIAIYTKTDFATVDLFRDVYPKLIQVNQDYEGYPEDADLQNRGLQEPDYGPAYHNYLKRRLSGLPALDHRSSGAGGTERALYILKGDYVYRISTPDPYLFVAEEDKNAPPYKNFERFLSEFKFIR